MRKAALILVALIVLLVVAVAVLPPIIGGNSFKPQIADAVREATGRELTIGGDIGLSLLPNVSVSASEIALSNAPGADPSEMLTIDSFELDLALLPLIGKNVVVQKLVVESPKVVLRQDEAGRGNWEFEGKAPAEEEAPAEESSGESPLASLQLGDVRITNGSLSYASAMTGQSYEVSDFEIVAALPDLDSPLTLDGGFNLNEQAVALDLKVETPGQAMEKESFGLTAKVQSEPINVGYAGQIHQTPVPGLDGQFDLNIDSVGALLAWLQQPLPPEQPDPGRLTASARFTADGAKATLEEAKIEGEGLQATATGSLDGSGDVTKVALVVEGGVLDIDRYLPPEQPGAMEADEAEPKEMPKSPEDVLAGLSDEPIDLSALKSTEADIKVNLGGVRAKGYEIGPIGLTAMLVGGKLDADLTELQLYGGSVAGQVALDGSGDALSADVGLNVDKVDLGALAAVAQPEGQLPVSGVVSAALALQTNGASPRALAQGAKGNLEVDLGGVDVADERAAAISELKLLLDLPGLDASPKLDASAIFNGQKVTVAVATAPLGEVMGGDPFNLDAKVDSKLVTAGYAGTVQQQPVPGLDGQFDLNVGSVGQLMTWVGQPLPKDQPDPGPLTVAARFKSDGAKATLEEAKISGDGLDATATGSVDASGDVKKIAMVIEGGVLDVDRYLPPPKPAMEAEAPADTAPPASPQDLLAGLPDEPIDLSALKGNEADIKVNLGGVKAMGYELGKVALNLLLQDGKLAVDLAELGLYGGNVAADLDLDGSGSSLGVTADATVTKVDLGALAAAAQPEGQLPVGGVVSAGLQMAANGASPRSLAQSVKGRLELDLGGIDVQDERAAALSALKLALDMPGIDAAPKLDAEAVYNDQPVTVAVALAPLGQVMGGKPFELDAKVGSALVTAAYAGKVIQQPVPGLDGRFDLDIGSVGNLLSWLGQPLPDGQPDPGALKAEAVFKADGGKASLETATITGSAFAAKANGSFDGSGDIARFDANLAIDKLDLNAYLPPAKEGEAAGESAPAQQQGWSDEPLDLAALRQANGQVTVTAGPILYKDLTINSTKGKLTLESGILNLNLDEFLFADGGVTLATKVDASGDAAALNYNANVSSVQAKQLLNTFSGIDWLSGTANLAAKGSAKGRSQRELVNTLNGDGSFQFLDGAIEGINLAETLRNVGTLGAGGTGDGGVPKTDFTELSGTFTITNGVVNNPDMKMLAPLIRLSGNGDVPLPPQTIDYGVEAKLVASLEGQGGDEALAGLPIPIRVTGPWSGMNYEVDWETVFMQAAADPERLAKMPAEMGDMAKQFGVDLPLPGLGGEGGAAGAAGQVLESVTGGDGGAGGAVGTVLESVTGGSGGEGGTEEGGVGGLVKGVLGGGETKTEGAAAPEEAAPAPAAEETKKADEPAEAVEEGVKAIKGLFGD